MRTLTDCGLCWRLQATDKRGLVGKYLVGQMHVADDMGKSLPVQTAGRQAGRQARRVTTEVKKAHLSITSLHLIP